MDKNLGNKIAYLRKINNLSQKDLATKLCVSNKTISKWECGNGVPDFETMQMMAKIFNISLDEFNSTQSIGKSEAETQSIILNKTKLIIIICSICAILITTIYLLCFFFIPRNPTVKDSNIFTIDSSKSELSCIVSNDSEFIDLGGSIELPRTNNWKLFLDINGLIEIPTKTVSLDVGDNIYYIVIENSAKETKTYTVNIRRKPMYIVTLDSIFNSGYENIEIEEGQVLDITNIENPTQQGYTFVRWDYDFSQPIMQNTTVNAVWVNNTYKIYYHSNNEENLIVEQEVKFNESVTLKSEIFTKTNYEFYSWTVNSDGNGQEYTLSQTLNKYVLLEDLHLYAKWIPTNCKIVYHSNLQNDSTVEQTVVYNSSVQLKNNIFSKDHYTLTSWCVNAEGTGAKYGLSSTINNYIVNGNLHLFACWTPVEYTITYNLDGRFSNSNNPTTYNIESDFILQTPTRKNNVKFLGWFIDGEPITKIESGNFGHIILDAEWTLYEMEYNIRSVLNCSFNQSNAVVGEKYYLPTILGEYEYETKVYLKDTLISTSTDINGTYFIPEHELTYTIEAYLKHDDELILAGELYVPAENDGTLISTQTNLGSISIGEEYDDSIVSWNNNLVLLNSDIMGSYKNADGETAQSVGIDKDGYALDENGNIISSSYGGKYYAFKQGGDMLRIPSLSVTYNEGKELNIQVLIYDKYWNTISLSNAIKMTNTTINDQVICEFSEGKFKLNSYGCYSVIIKIEDNNGNVNIRSFGIYIQDMTAPTIVIDDEDKFGSDIELGVFFEVPTAKLVKDGKVIDGDVSWEIYKVSNNASYTIQPNGFTPLKEGTFFIRYEGIDEYGNKTYLEDSLFVLTAKDTIAPVFNYDSSYVMPNSLDWQPNINNEMTVYIPVVNAVDPIINKVCEVTYKIVAPDGSHPKVFDYNEDKKCFIATKQGIYSIIYSATDISGNSSTTRIEVSIGDCEAPTLTWQNGYTIPSVKSLGDNLELDMANLIVSDNVSSESYLLDNITIKLMREDGSGPSLRNTSVDKNKYVWFLNQIGTYTLSISLKDEAGMGCLYSYTIMVV